MKGRICSLTAFPQRDLLPERREEDGSFKPSPWAARAGSRLVHECPYLLPTLHGFRLSLVSSAAVELQAVLPL